MDKENNRIGNDPRIVAVADKLFAVGRQCGWWPDKQKSWRDLDPIARDEFLALAEQLVTACKKASKSPHRTPRP